MSLPTVVIVDDSAEVRAVTRVRLRLSQRFAVVAEGATGAEAVELAREHRPALLLLDVSMPVMDGLEALPRVLDVSPLTRVVLYSGFDEVGLAERAADLGAAAFVQKSATAQELVRVLGDLVAAPEPADEPATAGSPPGERALTEHLERFREVFEEAAIGMATMTLTGRVVRANRALAMLVGADLERLVGQAYPALAGDADGERVAGLLLEIAGGHRDVGRIEHALARQAGRRVLATVAAVRDAQGRPLYLFLQVQDVTAQRAAEQELGRSEERFRLLVEAVGDYAIFMLEPDGTVASWNPGAQRIKGYSADEIVGRHFRLFYPPDRQAEGHPEHELEVALRDGHYEEEGWRVRKDGSRFWASVVITAIRNDAGRHVGFAKVTRDLTGMRSMQAEREAASAALSAANRELGLANHELAQRAAEQSDFLAVTAHELRSPISVLSGSAAMLDRHWDELEAGERSEMFEAISASSARLSRLLGDLLMASRLEAGGVALALSRTKVAPLLAASGTAARAAWPASVIDVDCPPGLTVLTDADRLAQVVDNLVGNALRHGRPPVLLAAREVGGRVEIRVTDAGSGVPAELRARLFQRFVSGEQRTGTGLGLYIVHELTRALGGQAWYDGDDPLGPTFVVAVPVPDDLRHDATR